MIFLLDYDRGSGRLVSMATYADDQRLDAQNAGLQLELELNQSGTSREIVLLEAADEDALRRTHRRYFEDLSELAELPKQHLETGDNVLLLGPPVVSKTHLAVARGLRAWEHGVRVLFTTAAGPYRHLGKALAEGRLDERLKILAHRSS